MNQQNLFPNNFSVVFNTTSTTSRLENYCFISSIGSTTGINHFTTLLTDWLFTFVIKGQYLFSEGTNPEPTTTCSENTLVIYKPGEHFAVKSNSDDCQRIWMHISGDMIPIIAKDLNIFNSHTIQFSENAVVSILNKFNNLRNAALLRKKNTVLISSRAMLLLEQFDQNDNLNNDSLSNLLENVLTHINDHYNEKISVSDLAKISNVSESYLIRTFKKKYELTPYQLIMSLRFSNASYYLKNTNKTIEEIAEICGFNDRVTFSASFTKQYGVSPSHYRNSTHRL